MDRLPDEWHIPTELSPDSDMSVDSVTSEVSESVVCMSVVSCSGMKPNKCGCGLELVRMSGTLFVLVACCSGLASSRLFDETLLCASGWGIILSGVLGPVWNLFGGLIYSSLPSPSGSNFLLPSGLGRTAMIGLKLLTKLFRVGLGLGLGVKELFLTGACMEGEKHCFPVLFGDSAPPIILGDVKMCNDSLKDRGRCDLGIESDIIGS